MNSLDQYIDLFSHNKALLESHSCDVMNSLRSKALESLDTNGLPHKGAENYETIDLDELLSPDFGVNLARIPIDANPSAAFRCGLPCLSNKPFFQINDIVQSGIHNENHKGFWIGSINDFNVTHHDILKKYYGGIADITNPLVALDTLLSQDGIVVYVEDDTEVNDPVQIVNILHNGMPLMAVRRLLLIIGDRARVRILACDHSQHMTKYLALQTTEIYVGKNASLDYYDLEESEENTVRLSSLYLRQEEGSEVVINGITLYNGITRNEYYTSFEGENSHLHLYGLGIEDRQRHLDVYSRIEHKVNCCVTDELFKYSVDDSAVGSFAGLVKVVKGADKTEAYQSNRCIVGSDTARMYSKPQLEIYDDDVKCSHGCAIGSLDEMQVFYLRSRGIPEAEAKFLLKQAFMADVIEAVRIPLLRDRLKLLVEKRFSGERIQCAGCGLSSSSCIDKG